MKKMLCMAVLALSPGLFAAGDRLATVYDTKPVVNLLGAGKTDTVALIKGQPLYQGEQVLVQPSGSASLVMADGSIVRLEGGSDLLLDKAPKGGSLLKLAKGLLRLNVQRQKGKDWLLQTPNATAAVKGTQYQVSASEESTEVQVLEGKVELSSKSGAMVKIGAEEAAVSYPDRVDAVRKLSRDEVKALKLAMKELVDQKKKEYAKRVREAKGKRTTTK